MNRFELEHYLHQHNPLSRAMGVEVVMADWHAVTLRAPLAPTINHRKTVFGGSASAVAILAAWALFVCSDAPAPTPAPLSK
jgi:thioesterase domain-containing protein